MIMMGGRRGDLDLNGSKNRMYTLGTFEATIVMLCVMSAS